MRLVVAAPGRLQHPGAVIWAGDLATRIGRLIAFERRAAKEVRRSGRGADARSKESEALLALLPPSAHAVALDARGRTLDSDAWLAWLQRHLEGGTKELWFLVGGPDGLDERALAACRDRVSLGPLTLPHELAEVVLLEQLYRALARWKGVPYHR
jgi:23S rRNA (pseudouridine1915-N3)-methyltransferase